MLIDEIQSRDISQYLEYLQKFWTNQANARSTSKIGPLGIRKPIQQIIDEPLPHKRQNLTDILDEIDRFVLPNSVNTGHPLFLAYVTPPSLDICALGETITAILNQNVSFANLSPIGAALEEKVIHWLADIAGYGIGAGGILVDGGSAANLYALAIARRSVIGRGVVSKGNNAHPAQQRIYCSEHIHRSVHKAAMLLGIGTDNVCSIRANDEHQVDIRLMERQIEEDLNKTDFKPTTIVGAAGTRACGAFDDLEALRGLAQKYNLWFHVDAAYGGFLRIADPCPKHLENLHLADSITIDPHKLLFVPFEAGCLLVRDRQRLIETFGVEGEYLERSHPPGPDYADLGMQLGRSMKALKVWLALKYIGVEEYGREFSRLLSLAKHLESRVNKDDDFELLAPVASIVVCFRWKRRRPYREQFIDAINRQIPTHLRSAGIAYVNEIQVNGKSGIRVCMSNFRTEPYHLDLVLSQIRDYAKRLEGETGQLEPKEVHEEVFR